MISYTNGRAAGKIGDNEDPPFPPSPPESILAETITKGPRIKDGDMPNFLKLSAALSIYLS
jgi:hypothetical protein